jgi:hypothetical protein
MFAGEAVSISCTQVSVPNYFPLSRQRNGTLNVICRRRAMHIEPVVLASRFRIIGENLEKLRESIDRGFFQDALRYAKQFRFLSDELAVELE